MESSLLIELILIMAMAAFVGSIVFMAIFDLTSGIGKLQKGGSQIRM